MPHHEATTPCQTEPKKKNSYLNSMNHLTKARRPTMNLIQSKSKPTPKKNPSLKKTQSFKKKNSFLSVKFRHIAWKHSFSPTQQAAESWLQLHGRRMSVYL